jgi:uncharacterized protein YqeY
VWVADIYGRCRVGILAAVARDAEGSSIEEPVAILVSEDEVAAIVAAAVAEVSSSGATGGALMGQVMKIVQPQVKGRADGGQVAALVKQALNQ